MKRILISDATLREATRLEGNSLSFKEKLEVAKRLGELKVDSIEVGPILDAKADAVLIRTISSFIKESVIACLASGTKEDIDRAADAISNAKKKRILLSIPASSAQIEYTFHKRPQQIVELIDELIKYAKQKCDDIELVLEDATRAEKEFLYNAITTAISAGVNTISICDFAGVMLPNEFGEFIGDLYKNVACLKDINLSVQCSNKMSMASSNSFAGIFAGANCIKTSVTNNVFPSLEIIAHIFTSIGDKHNIRCNLNTTEIVRIVKRINQLTTTKKDTSVFDSVIREVGENLTNTVSLTELSKIILARGYDISAEDMQKVYEAFIRVTNKKSINLKELDVIIASTALQVPATYKLKSYVINSGNIITSTANIILTKEDSDSVGLSIGDGPIDASFLAIEKITGHHFELDDFQIQAVTEGKDAMGEAVVKLRHKGKLYSGRGISTDIIGASIRAYVNALNKIVYEENNI